MENAEEKLGKLLEEFKGLRDDLSRVMLLFDSRIAKCERKLDREAQEREKADAEMSEKFERLVEKVNELAQNPVWRSKDSQRVALDRNETYEWCDRIGLPHKDALDELYARGMLIRSSEGRNTIPVRNRNGSSERVVMIKNYGNISIS